MTGATASGGGDGRPVVRVVHVIHSLGPGGAENVLVDLADVAATAGMEIVVVALSPHPQPVHAAALRVRGVHVVELGLARWDPRALLGTAAVIREHRPQVVHTHLKHADLIGAAAGRLLGVPVVSTLHVVEDSPVGRLGRLKRTWGLVVRRRSAARTIALSRAQRDWYRALSGSDRGLVVLPNGVGDPGMPRTAERARRRAALAVPDGRPLVVSAALMRPEKGHDLLLDAVALIHPGLSPVVALAGDGPLRARLEERVAADPVLRDRVRFLGYREDVPWLLGAADLVLHPSLADALPTTLMQALAVGVPVVATRVGGIPDIVGQDAGVLVDPDPSQLASALGGLLDDPVARERMGTAGRARYLADFEATAWAARLRDLYESVAASPAA